MIKFFRRIRQNLLEESKTTKYLTYALGEIALVVIGILIALSINNWNESRQHEKIKGNIYKTVVEDIKKDSSEVAMVLNFIQDRKNTFEKILHDSLTLKDIEENELIFSILTDVRVLSIEQRGYDLLRNFEDQSVSMNDSLSFRIINFYASSLFFAGKVENLIIDDLIKTNDLWKNQDWYAQIMKNNKDEKFKNYMLTDVEFKNLCAFRYSLLYENYVPTIEQFQEGGEQIRAAINARLDSK
ncbi:DUF6090 family protein [Flagellimonas algicola]|uniref:Uncharacterized protein n=1 Tax=Flagellimonas algicola TaxID=2583815 RepID=A0ABY2WMG1_9FLAO|nr:DUF6090 family protein [Allomuricauda algicola]TMU55564.1 hypothetical protein FGG15_15465 [Allomuricauda algicola]